MPTRDEYLGQSFAERLTRLARTPDDGAEAIALRDDAALSRRRRGEVLALFDRLSLLQWKRGSIHPERVRVTFADWTAGIAAHDDNHLAQMRNTLR